MFGSDNSIEPVRAVAAVVVTADGRTATRGFVEPLIREATAGELASATRRARSTSSPEPNPVQAVPEARRGFFRRRPAEPDKPDAIAQQHGLHTAEKGGTRRYFADYQQKQEVMRAGSRRITTKLDDKQTVGAMLDLAQSRGWDTVRLRGTPDFQREAWVQAQLRGIKAEGYKPTSPDQQEAARRKAAMAPVQASPGEAVLPIKVAESTAPSGTAVMKDAVKVTNSVTTAASAERADAPPSEVVGTRRQRQNVGSKRTAAATPASTAAPEAGSEKAKTIPQRSKAVWGAVEVKGQQARAADAITKATSSEQPMAAATV